MKSKNFYPNLNPIGRGGNRNICKLYAYTATLDWFKDFFMPNAIHANKDGFTFDYNTGLLTNTLNGKSIVLENKLIIDSGFIADFEENAKDTAQGIIYEQEISFPSDSDFAERLQNLNDTGYKQTMFVMVYNSGFARILGHYNGGASLLDKFKSGKLKSAQMREIKYTASNFQRAYSCTLIPVKTKDWVEWWVYRHDFFHDLNSLFSALNDGRFIKENGDIINIPIEDIEYEETTEVVNGINYLYSVARFKLPRNTIISADHNTGTVFNNGEYAKFLDPTGKVIKIQGSGQFRSMYQCVFGAKQLEIVGIEHFNGIQSQLTKSLSFQELTITGEHNIAQIESFGAKKVIFNNNSKNNITYCNFFHSDEIVFGDNADDNIKDLADFSANIITGKHFKNCILRVARNGIIREKLNIELAKECFVWLYDFSFPKDFMMKDCLECIKLCELIYFKDILLPGTMNSISSNAEVDFGGIIGPTLGNNNYCPNNIVGNSGTARFITAYLNINNGAPEGDVAVIIDPANNQFSSINFNL